MSTLELILRTIGVVQLGLLAGLMLHARRRDHAARIGAALCISVAAFLLTSMPGAAQLLGVFIYPLTAVCSTHPVWLWLFCAALFSDNFRLTRRHWIAIAAMAFTGLVYQSMWEPQWREGVPGVVQTLGVVFGAASLAFAFLAPLSVFAGKQADLDERRRRIRQWFVPVAAAYLAVLVVTQVIGVFAGQQTPKPLVLANLVFINALTTIALLTFVQMRVVNWLDLVEPAGDSNGLGKLEQGVLERLTRRLVPERLYLRDGLTIATLADLLDTQEHVLRRVINGGLGFRNFNDFLHSHRLREAAARLRDPTSQRVPVLTIALDVGYGSIGPFNRAFKERFGVTPTQYRRSGSEGLEVAAATSFHSKA